MLMSISDTLMWRYYEVLLHATSEDIASMQSLIKAGTAHPMELKKRMAYEIILRFWSLSEAQEAQQSFEELFQKKDFSHLQSVSCGEFLGKPIWIVTILRHLGAVTTSSEARRLIEAGAVTVDQQKILDGKASLVLEPGMVIKVGKHRFYKVS